MLLSNNDIILCGAKQKARVRGGILGNGVHGRNYYLF